MLHGFLDLPTFTFWKEKNNWTGSIFQSFNYRIFRDSVKNEGDEEETPVLRSVVWYGTDCFDLVKPEDYVLDHNEEFSPEGLEKTIELLNGMAGEYKDKLMRGEK